MDGWLPPRAPGANPPPRFDAAPAAAPDVPAAEEPEPTSEGAPPAPASETAAPSGWLPPDAAAPAPRDEPPRATQAAPARREVPRPWTAPPPRPDPARPGRPTPYGTAVATEPNAPAVWGLVLGIVALVLLFLSLGTLFLITLPCSAGAWILGRRALRRIEAGQSRRGAGQAAAALWLGRIGVLAGVVAMVAIIALTASGFDFEAFRDDLQRDLERRRDAAR
jgi:hypothetical protein